ncbi:hypothetical protein OUZ56_014439 [Daphnia magna]|uniref:Uncharacterized protein n=1 Tax=Daphnia magna TaxID=35525 RepID=A0ABR0AJR5_9CRUS|nr:hypothetical protein OUZ56_014439 [Daphnia magna]
MKADFGETQLLIRLMVDYANIATKEHALLILKSRRRKKERLLLEQLFSHNQYVSTLLPIRTVGVQVKSFASYPFCWRIYKDSFRSSLLGGCRTCSFCVALSSD